MSEQLINDRVLLKREGNQGEIVHVILSRPQKHNAVDMAMLKGIIKAGKILKKDKTARAVIMHGDGPSFCSGLDIPSVMGGSPVNAAKAYAQLWLPKRNIFQDWSMVWRELPIPVIAAIHGNCFGAGIQLALGADIRITTADAKLSIMEAKWGLVPDMGGPTLIRELMRADQAKELTMTGRILNGEAASEVGLVTHVDADPITKATAIAEEILTRSPDSVAASKFLSQDAWQVSEASALHAERVWQRRVLGFKNQRISVAKNTGKPEIQFNERSINKG